MSDVRLVATNPEDSSVVPVGCNSRGELLIVEPVIEKINNDVFINGTLSTEGATEAAPDENIVLSFGGDRIIKAETKTEDPLIIFQIGWNGGLLANTSVDRGAIDQVTLLDVSNAIEARANDDRVLFNVDYDGNCYASNLNILADTSSANWSTQFVDGEETATYIGPVINVREELEFLRTQVRALMEKLRMSPESGWPVWDGDSSS